jgi:hypothetical protein
MSVQAVESSVSSGVFAHRNGSKGEIPVKSVVVRLDNVAATGPNRRRIEERVRRLNRSLEESGTPFRLRLL